MRQLFTTIPGASHPLPLVPPPPGAGLMPEGRKATGADIAGALRELFGEPRHRSASQEVAAEKRAMPTPADVVGRLSGLLGAAS